MNKQPIYVVEGKNDTLKIKSVFSDAITFETNGLNLDTSKLNQLKLLSKNYQLVVFTDPDGPGKRIRQTINDNIDNVVNAFIHKSDAISKNKRKVGIEHATKEDIIKALDATYHTTSDLEIFPKDYYMLHRLIGFSDSKQRRIYLCDKLNIGYYNAKQLPKQIALFNITKNTIDSLMKEYNIDIKLQ